MTTWRKSNRSADQSSHDCVEVAWFAEAAWRKSSCSADQDSSADCIEVAWLPTLVTAVRDSKNADGSVITFPCAAWRQLLRFAN